MDEAPTLAKSIPFDREPFEEFNIVVLCAMECNVSNQGHVEADASVWDPTFQQLFELLDPHMQASCSVVRFGLQTHVVLLAFGAHKYSGIPWIQVLVDYKRFQGLLMRLPSLGRANRFFGQVTCRQGPVIV